MIDLHRHDECSTFDGFGKSEELAAIAKELGHTSLGIANHGNTNSLVKHFYACKDEGIKPVMGVEGYFLPKHKPQTRGYHLCIFAKDKKGYANMNTLQFEGEKQKYYNAIWDFDLLEKYSEGLICTSACVASYLARCIQADNYTQAEKYLEKMVEIFGDDFYIEVQPYVVTDEGLQEKVNVESIRLGKKLGIKCILTSDSHYGSKEDFDTYMKMHEIAKHDGMDIAATYKERYIPTEKELKQRFYKMHRKDFGDEAAKKLANEMIRNLEEIEDKVDGNILDELELKLPQYDETQCSLELLKAKTKEGLKKRGKWNKEYAARVKEELSVIEYHGFEDYFLMVADYTNWAKDQGIVVGPGRGSGCNCLVNYALRITDVDPILFDLDFSRFLRIDKKKMPDIDLDFETSRRAEVIEYLLEKYPNNAAQICSYGLYRVDNLINDLAKVSGLEGNKTEISKIKSFISGHISEGVLDMVAVAKSAEARMWNTEYDNIIKHFTKLYNKVRFIGTHAAGVAITSGNILDYTAIRVDTKTGKHFTSYDLNDMERIQVVKFDILGLTTMSSIGELRRLTGHKEFDESWVNDENVINAFGEGNCNGVFQFEKKSVQDMLRVIQADCFEDIVAASAMNRPGPLSLKMPEIYAANKVDQNHIDKSLPYASYLEKTYGCVVYQEQVQAIAVNIGGLEWPEADKILKMQRGGTEKAIRNFEESYATFVAKFEKGAKRFGMNKEQAFEIFDKFFNYAFNKGHSTGYSLVSVEEMFYKVYYPAEFWYTKMKYYNNDAKLATYKIDAVKDNAVIFLPHVNYSGDYTLRKVDGDMVIQEGLRSIKGVGEKAAEFIENERKTNGVFTSYDDFYDRCKSRVVTSRVVQLLKEHGALEFNKKAYIGRVVKYNSTLYAKSVG
ncbi:MAG: DNA polymerase III subunit alpha [Candidatus Pacebacteria bacterium]|nr:DNA polymerase III subunit alpha [Candidatus Paceibacterota bacterium]